MSGSRCTLHAALGQVEECPGADCPFWGSEENGCVLDKVQFEILWRAPLAAHLLELRDTLAAAGPAVTR
jgi:hypothetical protein